MLEANLIFSVLTLFTVSSSLLCTMEETVTPAQETAAVMCDVKRKQSMFAMQCSRMFIKHCLYRYKHFQIKLLYLWGVTCIAF